MRVAVIISARFYTTKILLSSQISFFARETVPEKRKNIFFVLLGHTVY